MVKGLNEHLSQVINPSWNYNKRCRDKQDELLNASMGLAGEAGEVLDCHKKMFFHREKDYREEIKLELGDVVYYLLKFMDLHGLNLDEILEANKIKLIARYKLNGKTV